MKRGRSSSQDAKDSSNTPNKRSREQDVDIRDHQGPRTTPTSQSVLPSPSLDESNQPNPVLGGGGVYSGAASSIFPQTSNNSSLVGRDGASQLIPNNFLPVGQDPKLGREAVGNDAADAGGARANPNFVMNNDNRQNMFSSYNFVNQQDPRTASQNQQGKADGGELPQGIATSVAEPPITIGHDANGMPIVVPRSVAFSLMSGNNISAGRGVPGMPPYGPQQQNYPYYPMPLPPREQQQPFTTGDNVGGHSNTRSGHSSAGTSSDDLQATAWRQPGANTGMVVNHGYPVHNMPSHMHNALPMPMFGASGPSQPPTFARGGPPPQGVGVPMLPRVAPPPPQLDSHVPPHQQQHPSASTQTRSHILHMVCDDEILSDYQCLVRKQIEVFEVQDVDIETNAQGRNKPIVPKQVGIRCRHCAALPPRHRARGSTYYPAKLQGLYQAAQNMASNHLCGYCLMIPPSLKQELRTLRDRKSPAGGGKVYWADGVRVLGVYEDGDCLRFSGS